MNLAEVDEDAIDAAALQAQIDLSMSFAQNLISSWVQPHKFPSNSRKRNAELELTEYMKRPPRLGVGAIVPEGSQSLIRETARLKGKLIGSKRPLEENSLSKSSSGDEGESRAVAIKSKARPDPFDVVHGKKRKKSKAMQSTNMLQPSVLLPVEGDSRLDSSDEIESLLRVPEHQDGDSAAVKGDLTDIGHLKASTRHLSDSLIKPISSLPLDEQGKTTVIPAKSQIDIQSSTTAAIDTLRIKKPGSSKNPPFELLKVPLLNLDGHPSDQASDDEHTTAALSATLKKKRKRRKKKKNNAAGDPQLTSAD